MITFKRFYDQFVILRRKIRAQQEEIDGLLGSTIYASEIVVNPIDNMDANNVQDGLQELQQDIDIINVKFSTDVFSPFLLMGG